MNGDNRLIYNIGFHKDRIFWVLFLILGVGLIASMIINVFYVDVLLGLILITMGLYKLGEEYYSRHFHKEHQRISEDMDNVMEWLTHNYEFTKRMKDTHENRLHHLDRKRADMENKIEGNYRDVVRKVIEIENKLNKNSKEIAKDRNLSKKADKLARLLQRERRMIENRIFDVSDRQMKTLRMVRKNGQIRTGEYVKAFRVREKTALRELKELVKKKFLRKRGKGRGTHYILGL